jgi:hypothetical protein
LEFCAAGFGRSVDSRQPDLATSAFVGHLQTSIGLEMAAVVANLLYVGCRREPQRYEAEILPTAFKTTLISRPILTVGFAAAVICLVTQASAQQQNVPRLTIDKLTPSLALHLKTGVPYPPQKLGCHHISKGHWEEVPCASQAEMMNIARPQISGIQSNPRYIPRGFGHGFTYTAPITWGSIAINLVNPAQAQETDVPASASGPSFPNVFSMQNNTNQFSCTLCTNGYPLPGIPNVPASASEPGDTAEVQFVFMSQYPAVSGQFAQSAKLCIWQIDATVAYAVSNEQGTQYQGYGYNPTCVDPPQIHPLTGNGAAEGGAEIFAFVTCPSGSSANCTLNVVGYLPWVDQDDANGGFGGWWAVTTPDLFGLSTSWTNISGSLLGHGNGSAAIFANAQMQTLVRAYSCTLAPQDPSGFTPEPCTGRALFGLSGTVSDQNDTAETNNLTNTSPNLVCEAYDRYLTYNSSAP